MRAVKIKVNDGVYPRTELECEGADVHLPMSQLKWRRPFKEWNANGPARIVLPASLTYSGRPPMNSTTCAELKTSGAARYAIA